MTVPNERGSEDQRSEQQDAGPALNEELNELQSSLAAAESRAAESRDLYMRALAELENVRRRASRDVEQAHKYALERVAGDLIGVKDSLELGLGSGGSAEQLREGTEATLKLLTRAFEKAGLVEIAPLTGEPFNPELHEAMMMQPSGAQPPNTVLQVLQKGYQLNGRVVRPARVIVAREP